MDENDNLVGLRMCVDPNGEVLITSMTLSTDLTTTAGAWDQTHNGNYDLFVARMSADLTQLLAATYV